MELIVVTVVSAGMNPIVPVLWFCVLIEVMHGPAVKCKQYKIKRAMHQMMLFRGSIVGQV